MSRFLISISVPTRSGGEDQLTIFGDSLGKKGGEVAVRRWDGKARAEVYCRKWEAPASKIEEDVAEAMESLEKWVEALVAKANNQQDDWEIE